MVLYQDGKCIFSNVRIADTFIKRLVGLMGRRRMGKTEALLFLECSRVHTCFMRFSIDIVYLDQDLKVIDVETLEPWRCGRFVRNAKHILELRKGKARMLQAGVPIQILSAERRFNYERIL